MQNISCYKPTKDDWCPNYSGNMVQVFYFNNQASNEDDIVTVTGSDDCSLSYCGKDAEYIFMRILELDYVNMSDVKKLGLDSDWGHYQKELKKKEPEPFFLNNKLKAY